MQYILCLFYVLVRNHVNVLWTLSSILRPFVYLSVTYEEKVDSSVYSSTVEMRLVQYFELSVECVNKK